MTHALAKDLRAAGFRVFEIVPETKRPAIKGWQARAEGGDLSHWKEGCAVGIAAGGPYPNGKYLVVVDIDNKPNEGKDGFASLAKLEEEHGAFPSVFRVRTKSGGMHIYMWSLEPLPNSVGKVAPGIDIRCQGGLVVAPGQMGYEVIEGSACAATFFAFAEWGIGTVPDWLRAAASQTRERSPLAGKMLMDETPTMVERARRVLEQAEPAVADAGGNNHTVVIANRVMDEGVGPDTALGLMIEHWNERCEPPWDFDELETIVRSAAKSRQTPIGSRAVELEFEPIDLDESSPPDAQSHRPSRRSIHGPEVIVDFRRRYLVKGLIDRETVNLLYGDTNVGKTFVVMDLMSAVAAGRPWMGRRTTPGLCLHVAMEGQGGVKKRYMALQREKGTEDLYLLPETICLTRAGGTTTIIDEFKRLQKEKPHAPAGIICIDTVALAIGGDEDSAESMGTFLREGQRIQKDTGATVLFVHHSGKDKSRGPRGSSALPYNVDASFEVHPGKIIAKKARDDAKPEIIPFKLRQVELGIDEDGDPVTSCVVDHVATVEAEFGLDPDAMLDGDARAAWETVTRVLAEEGTEHRGRAWAPQARLAAAILTAMDEAPMRNGWSNSKGRKLLARLGDAGFLAPSESAAGGKEWGALLHHIPERTAAPTVKDDGQGVAKHAA